MNTDEAVHRLTEVIPRKLLAKKGVTVSTQNQTFHATIFFYKEAAVSRCERQQDATSDGETCAPGHDTERPEFGHMGPNGVNHEAELNPPSRVACSDLCAPDMGVNGWGVSPCAGTRFSGLS
jgi:hypothetical protein